MYEKEMVAMLSTIYSNFVKTGNKEILAESEYVYLKLKYMAADNVSPTFLAYKLDMMGYLQMVNNNAKKYVLTNSGMIFVEENDNEELKMIEALKSKKFRPDAKAWSDLDV